MLLYHFVEKRFKVALCIILVHNCCVVQGAFRDYLSSIGTYFGYEQQDTDDNSLIEFTQKIPYEVSDVDQKFISEAVKLTGVALSDLDTCQQRVVLKLRTDCDKMNDEQLAKMAVHLLNCQSHVEGRRMFSCTEEMSIRDCTKDMDSDTWTSYHLMSNRARAVCYMIRQTQFRGLTEHTVNRLMEASKDQLNSLGKIARDQENIKSIAENTYDTLTIAHQHLADQQKDLQKAQFHGQLVMENNIQRLIDEKLLIHETHEKLVQMTRDVQDKLESSAKMIENQNEESRVNHKELLEDLVAIHGRAAELFLKIDDYSGILFKQNEEFKKQYDSTLKNLQEVNKTVHSLVNLVGGTRQALEDRLAWIMHALGGTDQAVDRLYLITWHVAFILVSMLSCAFLNARASTRLIVATLPPINLGFGLYGQEYLDPLNLAAAIAAFISAQTLIISALNWRSIKENISGAITWTSKSANNSPSSTPSTVKSVSSSSSNGHLGGLYSTATPTKFDYQKNSSRFLERTLEEAEEETDDFREDLHSLTPPRSRIGTYSSPRSRSRSTTPLVLNTSLRSSCHAKTRAGTPCKISSMPGRDFCYRHQNGDSIMG